MVASPLGEFSNDPFMFETVSQAVARKIILNYSTPLKLIVKKLLQKYYSFIFYQVTVWKE